MNDLLVIAFSSEEKAEAVRQKILTMQKEYLIELGDAVVAVKGEDGSIKLNQLFNTTAIGGVSGVGAGDWFRLSSPLRAYVAGTWRSPTSMSSVKAVAVCVAMNRELKMGPASIFASLAFVIDAAASKTQVPEKSGRAWAPATPTDNTTRANTSPTRLLNMCDMRTLLRSFDTGRGHLVGTIRYNRAP